MRVILRLRRALTECRTLVLLCGTAGQGCFLQDDPAECGTVGKYGNDISVSQIIEMLRTKEKKFLPLNLNKIQDEGKCSELMFLTRVYTYIPLFNAFLLVGQFPTLNLGLYPHFATGSQPFNACLTQCLSLLLLFMMIAIVVHTFG